MPSTATGSGRKGRTPRNFIIRASLALFLLSTGKTRRAGEQNSRGDGKKTVLLTGTFYSNNWIRSQLAPMALAPGIGKVIFVSSTPVDHIDGVEVIYPPKYLCAIIGGVAARLFAFLWHSVRMRPDIVGGYHLLVNGLVAQLAGQISQAQTLYVCVGGPTEVIGGGFLTENRIFGKLQAADYDIESQLLSVVNRFDAIVVRGESAKKFFETNGVTKKIGVITAGIDSSLFAPSDTIPLFDLVFLARLSSVKRIELFLESVLLLKTEGRKKISAIVIGDGPTRTYAERFIQKNGLSNNVAMLGYRDDVANLLKEAKIFVLTSSSEGLSQSMIQAMLCGLPVVVADVGSLSDIVVDGANGFLVGKNDPARSYAARVETLLRSESKRLEMGRCAREAALKCSVDSVAINWEKLMRELDG